MSMLSSPSKISRSFAGACMAIEFPRVLAASSRPTPSAAATPVAGIQRSHACTRTWMPRLAPRVGCDSGATASQRQAGLHCCRMPLSPVRGHLSRLTSSLPVFSQFIAQRMYRSRIVCLYAALAAAHRRRRAGNVEALKSAQHERLPLPGWQRMDSKLPCPAWPRYSAAPGPVCDQPGRAQQQ